MPSFSTGFTLSNIGGFAKLSYPEIPLIIYVGDNQNVSIKDDNYIEILDNDSRLKIDKLTQEERQEHVIDFANLVEKRGQPNAEAYVDDLITSGDLTTQIIENGNTGGGRDVTVIANDTDFSTETTLAALLAKIIAAPSTESKQDEIINLLSPVLIDRYSIYPPPYNVQCNSTSTIYALQGVKRIAGGTNKITIKSLSVLNTANDNYFIYIIKNPIVAGTFTYAQQGSKEAEKATAPTGGGESPNTVTGGEVVFSLSSRSINSPYIEMPYEISMENSTDTYVFCFEGITTNSNVYGTINLTES